MDNLITILDAPNACVKISESLLDQKELITSKLNEKLDLYKDIFNKEELDKLTYVMLDDLETYRSYILKTYNHVCPEYSRGIFFLGDKLSIVCITPEVQKNHFQFYKMLLSNAHEAFHYYFRTYIFKTDANRVVWFDEGLAQYFSGEYEFLVDEELKKFYNNWKKKYIPINNLNKRIQGTDKVSDELIFKRDGVFDGYNTSYLIVRYLIETKGEKYVIDLMRDRNKILEIGDSNIIDEMDNYYSNKFGTKVL